MNNYKENLLIKDNITTCGKDLIGEEEWQQSI